MTLDTRFPELDLFLQRLRRRLNLRFLAGEALAALVCSAPAALVGALILPLRVPRLVLWASLALGGAVAWTLIRWPRRLTEAQAASWFDESQGTRGLFRAAAEALDRETPAFPDDVVLRSADLHRAVTRRPRLPWRRLALRAGVSAAVVLASLVLLALPGPLGLLTPSGEPAVAGEGPAGPPPPLPEAPALTPKEAARQLFPEDQRLAALAEEALASGDIGALESLLDQNPGQAAPGQGQKRSPGRPSGQGVRPNGGGPGVGDQPQDGPSGQDGSPDGRGTPGGPSGGPTDQNRTPDQGQNPGSGRPGSDPRRQGSQDSPLPGNTEGGAGRESSDDQAPSEAGRTGSLLNRPGGSTPGSTPSDQKLGPRDTLPPTDRRVVAPEKGPSGVYEYVLPETGARVPLSQALADSRRSAEAALDRSTAPMEYENAVRQYFLTLSQEAKP